MRFISLEYVITASRRTLVRFPLVIASALLATVSAIIAVENGARSVSERLLMAATLGLPLFTVAQVVTERRSWSGWRRVALPVAGSISLALYFIASERWLEPVAIRRYIQFSLGLHLLVAFLPYAGVGERNGFWQYNKTLFIRFLVAALYSGVLFVGLSIALVAIDELFGVDVHGDLYLELLIVIAFVSNTWYFLAGVPRDFVALETDTSYPQGLKIFSQYILVPLVTVYLTILTVYLGRIAITREWPSGWIGYLVSSVAAAGMLSLLLVHPVQDRAENRWIKGYARGFHVALLPSIAMLSLAIWKRIQQYGVTENRYFLVVLTAWLLAITLYFIASRRKDIIVIPATLCVLAFGVAFGPWGAYSVSRSSQVSRLEEMLEKNTMLVDGQIRPATAQVPFADRREMSSVFSYLLHTHGVVTVTPWFQGALADSLPAPARLRRWEAEQQARRIMASLELEYIESWQRAGEEPFNLIADGSWRTIPVADYDWAMRIPSLEPATAPQAGRYTVAYDQQARSIVVREGGRALAAFSIDSLLDRAESGKGHRPLETPRRLMELAVENEDVRALLAADSISGKRSGDSLFVWSFQGTVYVGLKNERR